MQGLAGIKNFIINILAGVPRQNGSLPTACRDKFERVVVKMRFFVVF
jgi:hypothetical protein